MALRRFRLLVGGACMVLMTMAAADGLGDPFDLDDTGEQTGSLRWSGYGDFSGAYTYREPERWSKLRTRLQLAADGRTAGGLRYHLSGRGEVDAAYSLESRHYPRDVRRDQRDDFSIREAYVDFSRGDMEFRLGRQQVVWGEMVGLFMADVVSARDMRESILPDFDDMRIAQWAARAEYFAGNSHFELLWVPFPSFDNIGKPGADFYPYPFLDDDAHVRRRKPSSRLSNTNWGARASHLISGWDLSAFYYDSLDIEPSLYHQGGNDFELRHDRIRQFGGTFSKDMGNFVLKGEAVHTDGRSFLTRDDPDDPSGRLSSRTLDYAIGVDVPVGHDWDFNVQFFGRHAFQHAPEMGFDRDETGATFQARHRFTDRLEAELLHITSLNRSDYLVSPRLTWFVTQDWRARFGADVFGGREQGLFGRYDDQDRIYAELRYFF